MIKFTKEEKTVLLFLLAALFVGSAVMYCKKMFPLSVKAIEFGEPEEKNAKKININKATGDVLTGIRGVGPVLAGRIIRYREKNGDFRMLEEIKKVKGIGEKTYEKIKKQITLE